MMKCPHSVPFPEFEFIALIGITIFTLVIRRESKEGVLSLAPSENLCKYYNCLSSYFGHQGHKNDSQVENSDLQACRPLELTWVLSVHVHSQVLPI